MATLVVGEFIDNVVPSLVHKACMASLRVVTMDDVNNVINGKHTSVTRENQRYILNMYSAYKYAVLHMGYVVTADFVVNINYMCGLGISRFAGVFYESTTNELNTQLNDLCNARDGKTRAVVAFAYIVSSGLFEWGDLETAWIICNHFLISQLIGFLSISENDMDELRFTVKAAKNGDAGGLISLLYRSIVEFR